MFHFMNRSTRYTVEEQLIFEYIENHLPLLLGHYRDALPAAREKISERLLNALIREWEDDRTCVELAAGRESDRQLACFLEKSQQHISFTVTRQMSFSRFKLKNPHLMSNRQSAQNPLSPLEIARYIADEGDFPVKQKETFLHEVADSTANLAFALAWQSHILESNGRASFGPTYSYEQFAFNGHSIHPGAKAKIGMTADEVFRYSPEFGQRIRLHFAAVKQEFVQSSFTHLTLAEVNALFFGIAEGLETEFSHRFGTHEAGEWLIVPVHPWQWEHTLFDLFGRDIEHGHIRLLDTTLPAWPTLSIRTVIPDTACEGGGAAPHIKLPMNVQTTSAVRALSIEAVQNGPLLTKTLRQIMEQEPDCRSAIRILGEIGGVNYMSPLSEDNQPSAKHLAFLLRENPDSFLADGEIVVVGAALLETAAPDGRLLIEQFIRASYPDDEVEEVANALSFFSAYCDIALIPLKLLSKYGIGLETHLQNSLIVFRDGLPVRMMIRDLGGARIDLTRLHKQGFDLPCREGASIIASIHDARTKLIHALMQNHLGELINVLSCCYGLQESSFWSIVSGKCRKLYAQWKQDAAFAEEAAADEEALFAPNVQIKALTKMRLVGNVKNYVYANAANPLFEKGQEKR